MYVAGMQIQVNKLMPPVVFPVSRGTPMISPLVRWQHSDDWHVAIYKNEVCTPFNEFYAMLNQFLQTKLETGERTVTFDLNEEDVSYISGHKIDNRILFPATGYLVCIEKFSILFHFSYSKFISS
jgi:fatty acid synthase, animal type